MESQLPWRERLEVWPDHWRERWGLRANALEDGGMSWREAEKLAWNEVLSEKREAENTPTIPMATTKTQARFKESA